MLYRVPPSIISFENAIVFPLNSKRIAAGNPSCRLFRINPTDCDNPYSKFTGNREELFSVQVYVPNHQHSIVMHFNLYSCHNELSPVEVYK